MLCMDKPRPLTNEYKLTARTIRAVHSAVKRAVRHFADEGKVRFRGRKLGDEAFLNAAAWYLADQDRARQEQILKAYLPRIEAYLSGEPEEEADEAAEQGRKYTLDHTEEETTKRKGRKSG